MKPAEFVVTIPGKGWMAYLIASSVLASATASYVLVLFPPWPCEELTFQAAFDRSNILMSSVVLVASWILSGAVASKIDARPSSIAHLFLWVPFGAGFFCIPIMFFGLQPAAHWRAFWHCLQPDIHSTAVYSLHMIAVQILTFGILVGSAVLVRDRD